MRALAAALIVLVSSCATVQEPTQPHQVHEWVKTGEIWQTIHSADGPEEPRLMCMWECNAKGPAHEIMSIAKADRTRCFEPLPDGTWGLPD